jgi:hypothetical protein
VELVLSTFGRAVRREYESTTLEAEGGSTLDGDRVWGEGGWEGR